MGTETDHSNVTGLQEQDKAKKGNVLFFFYFFLINCRLKQNIE